MKKKIELPPLSKEDIEKIKEGVRDNPPYRRGKYMPYITFAYWGMDYTDKKRVPKLNTHTLHLTGAHAQADKIDYYMKNKPGCVIADYDFPTDEEYAKMFIDNRMPGDVNPYKTLEMHISGWLARSGQLKEVEESKSEQARMRERIKELEAKLGSENGQTTKGINSKKRTKRTVPGVRTRKEDDRPGEAV